MNDSDILAMLNKQISNAKGGDNSTTNSDKATALDYYNGDESIIDADEGESSIITREVFENVERELGQQLKVFASGERFVQFDAVSDEDEEQAEQETDYVNYIYDKENNGFKITHDWIKSALIEKNAYVKVWVEESEESETQTYSGLNDFGLAQVLEQENVEPLEHTEEIVEDVSIDSMTGQEVINPTTIHDIKIKVTTKEKKIKVQSVPNEEMGVARNHNELSLKNCSFVYHRPQGVTASDLVEAGFDKDLIKTLPSYNDVDNELQIARNINSQDDHMLYDEADESTREIEVYECYIRFDHDGDGVAELRKVIIAGNEILDNDECDFIPFATLSPLPMPYRHEGLSYADCLMDIQDVSTVLTQQILTNLYFTNMPELEIAAGVNLDDVLSRKSGSVNRVEVPGSINPITIPFTAGASLPILELMQNMAEKRVGSSQPLDPNVLSKTSGAAFIYGSEQANQLSEKLARIFAETGFKELFGMIHELSIKHIDRPKMIKLRNKFVEVDPTEWKHRSNMSIVVGLGTSNKDQEIQKLFALSEKQEQHLMQGSPMADYKKLYNTYSRIIEKGGLQDPTKYWNDPNTPEFQQQEQQKAQQQQPNQLAEAEQVKGQFAIQKTQIEVEMKGQLEQFKQQSNYEKEMLKAEHEAQLQALKTQLDDRARELDRESKEGIAILQSEIELIKAGIQKDLGQLGIGAELG